MGVTIHYTLMQEAGRVKQTLDAVEEKAKSFVKWGEEIGIPVVVARVDDKRLYVNVDGCETLSFEFMRHSDLWKDWRKEYGEKWRHFDQNESDPHYTRWPNQISYWASGFCKTQFSRSVYAHFFVAELVRECASVCKLAKVDDEGDYYHTKVLKDAHDSIVSNGKLIDSLAGQLREKGFSIVKNETHIKNTTKKYE